jgi:ABC-type dipeptide/oligopeptide/nickel transport system ATPase component
MASEPLLQVRGLKVRFVTEDGTVRAVDGVDFELERGQVLGIVGESGSGKSVTALTVLGLTRATNTLFEGEVVYKGQNLLSMSERSLRAIRGKEIAMIFQDPISSLSPVQRIGDQIVEQIRAHEKISKSEAMDRTVELMERVGIPRARDRARAYPNEF